MDSRSKDLLLRLQDEDGWNRAGYCLQNRYAVKLTSYYAGLMGSSVGRDPIALQSVPRLEESTSPGETDPLLELEYMPVDGLIHVYTNRALLLVTERCFVNCRHCNRRWKRRVDGEVQDWKGALDRWADYIGSHPEIDDVLVTGGDPLTLGNGKLFELLARLRSISHVGVVRVGSRAPVVMPARIDDELVAGLKENHPIFLHTQFNHPRECTMEAGVALERLADAGVNLGNQMVLLAGVNDSVDAIAEVNRWLVRHRCRPYYLFVPEDVRGTGHFKVSLQRARELEDSLRQLLSGIAMPSVVVDMPDGGGKVPVWRADLSE